MVSGFDGGDPAIAVPESCENIRDGWCLYSHTKGDHLIYHFPGALRPVVIPKYKEVPVFVIRNNMKVIGLSRDRFLEIASNV